MQDLTPQLRTRLGRVERAVGLFVLVATLLLLTGFLYYLYHTAQRKGWFQTKVPYYTELLSAAGLKVGDPVKLMGFDVGEITRIDALAPDEIFNVYVEFRIKDPYYGYLWTHGSFAKVGASDFLGKRYIEVTKGDNYIPTYLFWEAREYTLRDAQVLTELTQKVFLNSVKSATGGPPLVQTMQALSVPTLKALAAAGVKSVWVADKQTARKYITYIWDLKSDSYQPYRQGKIFWLPPVESPALTERLEDLVNQVTNALPAVFNLTNQLSETLTNLNRLLTNANQAITDTRPTLTNLAEVTALLRNPNGSLGQWLIPTDIRAELLTTLTNANGTLTNASATLAAANTNLVWLVAQLDQPLQRMSLAISNINAQVQANTNFVAEISSLVVHVDELIQGFKRHWLLRGAFKEKPTKAPPPRTAPPKGGRR